MSGGESKDLLAGVPQALISLLPELCEELRRAQSAALEAADRGDPDRTAGRAHAFKSASMLYGLTSLASAAGQAEDAARDGRLGEARTALTRCAALLGDLESACAGMEKA